MQHRHSLTNGLSCNGGDVSFTTQSQTKLLRRIARIGRMDLQELEAIAERELLKHGLHDWSFGWARTKRRQGACNYRSKRIEIAEYYASHNPPEKVIDTLLHEIAHALAGPKARHGPAWKAVAKKLGATPRACDTCRETVVMPGDFHLYSA